MDKAAETGKPFELSGEWFREPSFPFAVNGGKVACRMTDLDKEPNYTFMPHCHDFYEMVIVIEGVTLHHVGERSFTVSPGDIFVVLPNAVHYFDMIPRLCIYNIMFSPSRLQLPWDMLAKIPGFNMLMQIEPKLNYPAEFKSRLSLDMRTFGNVVSLAQKMNAEFLEPKVGYEASILAKLTELLVLLSRNYTQNPAEAETALSRISNAIALMEKSYAQDLSVADIAQAANTSPRNFQRLFQIATGSKPIEYLNAIRLRHASEALCDHRRSVLDVAYECGFKTPSYFAKKFRDVYGVTPDRYRRG